MTWGEFLNSVAVGASILGAMLGLVSWAISTGTNRLIRQGTAETKAILERMDQRTHETLDRMDARAEARHRERG